MHAEDTELVPLKAGFDISWRGFNRDQVRQHLEDLAEDMRLVAADRDVALSQVDYLTRSLERSRAETEALRKQMDRLCRGPVNAEQLSDRLKRMLELANAEASEITARAQAAAEHTRTSAAEAANTLKQRYQRLLIDVEEQQKELVIEHRTVMQRARLEVKKMTMQAEERCRELDAEAEKRRVGIERDFQISMEQRRRTVDKQLADEQAVRSAEAKRLVSEANAQAERRMTEATSEAERLLTTARAEVDELRALRERINAQLSSAMDLMRGAAPLLEANAELDGAARDQQADTNNGRTRDAAKLAQDETVRNLKPVPEQQRHSALPPSKTKVPLRPTPAAAAAGSGR